jgi:hypothetical protein
LPPTHVFEVNYSEEKNKKFELLKQQLIDSQDSNTITPTTSLSFHGTSMCNIYSILHSGLLGHFSKNALFGEGTYLSQGFFFMIFSSIEYSLSQISKYFLNYHNLA